MKIGFVGEYAQDNGEFLFAENASPAIEFLSQIADVYVLNPSEEFVAEGVLPVVNVHSGRRIITEVGSLDGVYFGKVGKSIERVGQYNCFSDDLEKFFRLLEGLTPYEETQDAEGIRFINPSSTILYNLSKKYLMDLQDELPFIETQEVDSLDQLVALARGDRKMIAKPLVSERAVGTVILDKLSDEELAQYFSMYAQCSQGEPSSLYGQAMAQQGIIAQPYIPEFATFGEKKIAVVNGTVTLARRIEGTNGEIVAVKKGSKATAYEPTPEEVDVSVRAFHKFNEHYPADFMRVDIVGEPGNIQINEIEAINPDLGEHYSWTDRESQLNKHHSKLFSSIEKGRYAHKGKLVSPISPAYLHEVA